MADKMHINLFTFAMIGCVMLECVSSKTTHIVGDSWGWNIPKYNGFFDDWAKNRTFAIGDELLFKYSPGLNTVAEVPKDDYDHCTLKNSKYTYFIGYSTVTLGKPGDYYFFSSVGKHCEAGQKLWVNVPHGNHPSN